MMEERPPEKSVTAEAEVQPANWVVNTSILWSRRDTLARVAVVASVVSLAIAFLIPKQYESSARIMPPESSSASSAAFAALAGRALGELGGLNVLAGGLLGTRNTSALFVDLLRSGTIVGHLIDRFELQHVYHKRYRIDTAKALAHRTTINDDKKSGVITITVQDSDPRRARDLAQGYLDELNFLVNKTNTSSAHQERIFIERRLNGVEADLERAQLEMSNFSSSHTTIDMKEQTRAMVDAAATLQAQLIVTQSEIGSLRQIYGDSNVRIRAAQARAADLQHELKKMSGTSAPLKPEAGTETNTGPANEKDEELYPPLRQLPRLAVPYANLYRRVRVQEAVYELLTQQYEVARIQEAKDVPVVSVIDAPGIPEKKSFPPRALLALLLTLFTVTIAAAQILIRNSWGKISAMDPGKQLIRQITADLLNNKSYIPRRWREG